MKKGDLVRWSDIWLRGAGTNLHEYKDQVGVVIRKGEIDDCWMVLWNNSIVDEVHVEYLELI